MKDLRFRYLPIHQIVTPLPIAPQAIQTPTDLSQCLALIFPHKAVFFQQQSAAALTISRFPTAPFGPDADALIALLFQDFPAAVAAVQAYFHLPALDIVGPSYYAPKKTLRRKRPAGMTLSLFEFYELYTAIQRQERSNSLILSLFFDADHVFCLHVPQGKIIQEVFEAVPQLQALLRQHPECRPIQPFLQKEIDPQTEPVSAATTFLMFTQIGYTIRPAAWLWWPFPYVNRVVHIRKGGEVKARPVPCCNCLACAAYCPAGIFPSVLYHHLVHGNQDDALQLNLRACTQCGYCTFVCPSHLPLCETITASLSSV